MESLDKKNKSRTFPLRSRPLFVSLRVIFYIDPKKNKRAHNRQIENPLLNKYPLTYKKEQGLCLRNNMTCVLIALSTEPSVWGKGQQKMAGDGESEREGEKNKSNVQRQARGGVTSHECHNWAALNREAHFRCVNKQVQGGTADQYSATRTIRQIYCGVIGCKMTQLNLHAAEKKKKEQISELAVALRQQFVHVTYAFRWHWQTIMDFVLVFVCVCVCVCVCGVCVVCVCVWWCVWCVCVLL